VTILTDLSDMICCSWSGRVCSLFSRVWTSTLKDTVPLTPAE